MMEMKKNREREAEITAIAVAMSGCSFPCVSPTRPDASCKGKALQAHGPGLLLAWSISSPPSYLQHQQEKSEINPVLIVDGLSQTV